MKKLFLFFILAFALNSWAQDFTPFAKVYSWKEDLPSKKLIGSGLLFKNGGQTYLLTSDHVIYHDEKGFKHKISNETWGVFDVHFIASDWAYGIALLRLDSPAPEGTIPSLDDLRQGKLPEIGSPLQIAGYPQATEQILWDQAGIVSDSHLPSEVLAYVEEMIQLKGTQGQYGMSGSMAFSLDPTTRHMTYAGMLSHQLFNNTGQNEVLLIPMNKILEWLDRYFKDSAHFVPYIFRESFDQINDYEIYLSGGINLDIANLWNEDIGDISTAQVVGHVPYDSSPLFDPTGFIKACEDYKKIHGIALFAETVPHFRMRRKQLGEAQLSKIYFKTLQQFLRLLKNPDMEPVMTLAEANTDMSSVEALATKIAQRLEPECEKFSARSTNALDQAWRLRLQQTAYLIAHPVEYDPFQPRTTNRPFVDITVDDIREILAGPVFAQAWENEKTADPAHAERLKKILTELEATFKRLSFGWTQPWPK